MPLDQKALARKAATDDQLATLLIASDELKMARELALGLANDRVTGHETWSPRGFALRYVEAAEHALHAIRQYLEDHVADD
jgi:hypothetical protein